MDRSLFLTPSGAELASSTVMDAKVPMMLDGNDDIPDFKIDLHIRKDLKNALETGHGVEMGLPLTAQVMMEMMRQLAADGFGGGS